MLFDMTLCSHANSFMAFSMPELLNHWSAEQYWAIDCLIKGSKNTAAGRELAAAPTA